MRTVIGFFLLAAALAGAACGGGSDRREFTLQGQVLSVTGDHTQATIKHDEIKGFMPAMTMPYHARDAKEFQAVAPGDLVKATLVVVSNDAYVKDVTKTGSAPLEKVPEPAPSASSGFELLKEGDQVPNAQFVDQNGTKRDFASFKGSPILLTFIYTKCPMPTFCPLMDRHFAAIQKTLKSEKLNVQLVSVSFDPVVDTPKVLKAHAKELGADEKTWTFLTGDRDDIDKFGAGFGLSVSRSVTDQRDITHTLRTAIVNREGKLVKVYIGNEWTPEQALADVKALGGTGISN